MICPFCRETEVGNVTGPTACPACKAGFEIDDWGECVFVDTGRPRMQMNGQIFTECGLGKHVKRETCVCGGANFNRTVN